MGYLTANVVQIPQDGKNTGFDSQSGDSSAWRWRFFMAEQLAARLDPQKYGVKKLYLIGSTSNGSAGPASDVDLLVHFQGNEQQKEDLRKWFQGWSECLAELNFLKTGYTCDGLLDVHIITDEDIANKNPFAVHVDNIHEPAHELAMMNPEKVKS
jgi:predicted nucleotidyltransferase